VHSAAARVAFEARRAPGEEGLDAFAAVVVN